MSKLTTKWFIAYRDEVFHEELTIEEFNTREEMLERANKLEQLQVVIIGVWAEPVLEEEG